MIIGLKTSPNFNTNQYQAMWHMDPDQALKTKNIPGTSKSSKQAGRGGFVESL